MLIRSTLFALALAITGLVGTSSRFAAATSTAGVSEKAMQPVVIFLETDPWLSVIGSDVPAFTLYANGTVIFRRGEGYFTSILPESEKARIIASVRLADGVKDFSISNATDQPSTSLLLVENGKVSGVQIYGRVKAGEKFDGLTQGMVDAVIALRQFDDPVAKPWLPENIEVMIWPYEYAPDASIEWPRDWPGLEDAKTVKRGDSYSLFLPARHFDELKALLARQQPKGAVKIGGHKWAVAWRLPLPGVR